MKYRTAPTRSIVCAHCGQTAVVQCNPTVPVYCSANCKRNAANRRNKQRRQAEKRGEQTPCPVPAKKRYKTEQLAQREADNQPYRQYLRPYLCRCNDWHLTGMSEDPV